MDTRIKLLLDLVAIEQFIGRRSIAVVVHNSKLFSAGDDLKGNLVVFWTLAPSTGFRGPNHAVALDLASIIPDEIVDRPDVAQEHDVPVDSRYTHDLGIATRDRCNRGPANRFGCKRGCGHRYLWRKASRQN